MITFSLNTFIKICLLDTGGRISEIQKKLSASGGYDFYKPLQKAIRAYCRDKNFNVNIFLDAPTRDAEREYNRKAFEGFKEKFGAHNSLQEIKNPKTLEFSNAGIAIYIDPLFETSKSGVRQIYIIWPMRKPELSQRYGAVACHIMRQAYATDSLSNGAFFFADSISGKLYSEKQITNNTSLILTSDINGIGNLVKEL